MATLAELLIKMSVDTAQLKAGMDKSVSMAQAAAEGIKTALESVGIGLGLHEVIGGMEDLVEKAGELGEQLSKAKEITGLSAAALSGLRAEAQQTGEDFGGLTVTMGRLQKNIEAGIISPGSAAGKTLVALLGSVKDLKELGLEPADKQIQTIMQSIFRLSNEDERNYALTTLLGKGWQGNIETLKALGTEGLDPLEKKAEGLFGLYSDAQIAQLKKYGEELNRLKTTFDNVAVSAGGFIAEFLEAVATAGGSALNLPAAFESSLTTAPSRQSLLGAKTTLDIPGKAAKSHRDALDQMAKESHDFWEKYNAGLVEATEKFPKLLTYEENFQKFLDKQNESLIKQTQATYDLMRQGGGGVLSVPSTVPGADLMKTLTQPSLSTLQQGIPGLGGGVVPQDQWEKLQKASTGIADVNTHMSKLDQTAQEFGAHFSSSLETLILTGKGFHDILRNLIADLADLAIQSLVFKSLANALGGGVGKGAGGAAGAFFFGAANPGGKQSGGPVTAGSLYMVGESGPELFAPGASGSIIPNGGGGDSIVNIDARGAQPGVEHNIMRAIAALQRRQTGTGLVAAYEYRARGGTL